VVVEEEEALVAVYHRDDDGDDNDDDNDDDDSDKAVINMIKKQVKYQLNSRIVAESINKRRLYLSSFAFYFHPQQERIRFPLKYRRYFTGFI